MTMAEIWHHCRKCGEEGLTPEHERCPQCGTQNPVSVCRQCRLPIREGVPWNLFISSNDRPGFDPLHYSYHQSCYTTGKRKARRKYKLPDWSITLDRRDAYEPLPIWRIITSVGLLLAGLLMVIWLVDHSPRPQQILTPVEIDTSYRSSGAHESWGKHWFRHRPAEMGVPHLVMTLIGFCLALWFIRWRLFQPRPFTFHRLFENKD